MSVKYNLSSVPGFDELVNDGIGGTNTNALLMKKMTCRSNNAEYKVICYDKDVLKCDLVNTVGLCRSVIVNSNNKVVGFAPPKSISAEAFIKKFPERENVIAEEFVEGTMINVFYDDSIGDWEISTKNTVGATSSFYKTNNTKTFRQMFMEAAEYCNLDIRKLDKEFSYSFVLQHPENRIVVPFKVPMLYLVAGYKILNEQGTVQVEPYHSTYFNHPCIRFPKIYEFNGSYWSVIDKYTSCNTPYDVMGVVLYNKATGERAKVRNPTYEQIRLLRGNQSKLQYQYLHLRKTGKVKEFLKYYPETKKDFSYFRDQVHMFSNTLYENYVSCYIKKEKPLNEYPDQYKTLMYNIHKYYLNELREKKEYVSRNYVRNYVNNLHTSLLMHCLNYNSNRKRVDEIKNDPIV